MGLTALALLRSPAVEDLVDDVWSTSGEDRDFDCVTSLLALEIIRSPRLSGFLDRADAEGGPFLTRTASEVRERIEPDRLQTA